MSSNKREMPSQPGAGGPQAASAQDDGVILPARLGPRGWCFLVAGLALLPFAAWLIGSGIVFFTPAVYHGGAMVQVHGGTGSREACEQLKSEEVVAEAVRTLSTGHDGTLSDPMSAYLLWSSLSVEPMQDSNLVKVEARSTEPEQARKIVMALVSSYENKVRSASENAVHPGTLVYISPVDPEPTKVTHETRVMLGVAGAASVCLLLCVPFLRFIEKAAPLRIKLQGMLASSTSEPLEWPSGTAQAS